MLGCPADRSQTGMGAVVDTMGSAIGDAKSTKQTIAKFRRSRLDKASSPTHARSASPASSGEKDLLQPR